MSTTPEQERERPEIQEWIMANAWRASPASTAAKWSAGQWIRKPHLNLISREVAKMANEPIRLIVNLPPRHGKSELISHWTPIWKLVNQPNARIGLASYEADFAKRWSRLVRDTIKNLDGSIGVRLGDYTPASGWELETGGSMVSAGVGGPFTGRGFDLIIIDDPIKNAAEAASEVKRNQLWNWWQTTARTRLEPNGSIIIIMTRWHEDDIVGRLLNPDYVGDNADQWKMIRLPAVAESEDYIGRSEGEPLWPERFSIEDLAEIREDVGPLTWVGLYQQRPSNEEGEIFHRDWWQWADSLERGKMVYQYWDTAQKTGQSNDYSVCVTLTSYQNAYGLLDVWRKRVEYPDMIRAMKEQHARWNANRIFIEDKSSGQSAIQTLRRETRLPIIAAKILTNDKVERANSVTGTVEAGKVLLPKNAKWVDDFLSELTAFDRGTYDDQVDAFVGALSQFVNRGKVGIYA